MSFPSVTSTAVIALIPPVVPSIHSVFSQLLNLSLRYVFTANPACEYHAFELLYLVLRLWLGSPIVFIAAPYGIVALSTIYAEVLGAARILVRSSSMFFNGNGVNLIFLLSGIVKLLVPAMFRLYAMDKINQSAANQIAKSKGETEAVKDFGTGVKTDPEKS